MYRITLTALVLYISIFVNAQTPEGYYKSAENLKGQALKTALHKIIRGHVQFYYTKGSPNVWEILQEADKDTVNPDNVILLYTGKSITANHDHGKNWNREHVWAKSHGNFGTKIGAGTDVHAIRPCNPEVNSARSNYDFAEGGKPYLLSATGEDTGCKTTSNSWEPRDAVKGDIARMLFYMATRYEGQYDDIKELDLKLVDYVGNYSKPLHGKLSDLRKWHKNDPVDSMEIRRNNTVFKYQKNRNPFIDHPEYVDLIYDNLSATSINDKFSNVYFVKVYPNPAKSFLIVEFDEKISKNKDLKIQVFDLSGTELLLYKSNSSTNVINCNNLAQGLYLLKVSDNENVIFRQKIVIK